MGCWEDELLADEAADGVEELDSGALPQDFVGSVWVLAKLC